MCPFCRYYEETFEHIFHCPEGLSCPLGIRFTHQDDLTDNPDDSVLMLKVGKYLLKYRDRYIFSILFMHRILKCFLVKSLIGFYLLSIISKKKMYDFLDVFTPQHLCSAESATFVKLVMRI